MKRGRAAKIGRPLFSFKPKHMTPEQAYEKLRTDTDYLVSVMVANNLEALNTRAEQLQLIKAPLTADGMFSLMFKLSANNDIATISELVNGIDYAPNKLTRGNDKFFFENFSPLMNQAFVGPPTEEEFWGQYEQANEGDWWTDFDWGGVIDSLGGFINVFSNWGENEETPGYNPNPQPPTTGNGNNSGNNNGDNGNIFSADNLKTFGPYVVIVLLIAWMAYRKKL